MIPLIFILPVFLENKLMAVFLAEAVSDLIAGIITTVTFLALFPKILQRAR